MENRSLKIIVTIVLFFAFSSCASFSKKGFRNEIEDLKTENISKLNGNYSYHPIKKYFSLDRPGFNSNIPDSLHDVFTFLFSKSLNKNIHDSISKLKNNFTLDLSLESNTLLKVRVLDKYKIIKDTTLTGRYKKGMFNLDNKFLECNGIPYILGGCRNNKKRIGLTKNGNLLINKAVHNEGALLLFIGSGFSYNVTYEYQRVK